jgi:PKD repeat protein
MSDRRSGPCPGRRFAFGLARSVAGALTVGMSAVSAAAADSPALSATVYNGRGSTQQSVSLSDLQQNVATCPEYPGAGSTWVEYGRGGRQETQGLPSPGPSSGTWALKTVLACLPNPIDPAAITAVVVLARDGSAEQPLAPADLSPGQFNDASEVPVVEDFGDQMGYDRPWRGGSDEDYLDQVQEPSGSPITVEVYEGPTVQVTATANPTTIDAGASVAFSSTVQGPDTNLRYAWTFDGGAPASSDPSPNETFATAGVYNANLIVTDPSTGAIGSTQPITITVNTPSGQQTSTTGGTPQPGGGQGQSPTGPQQSPGTTPGGTPPPRGHPSSSGPTAHSGAGSPSATGRHHRRPRSPHRTPPASASKRHQSGGGGISGGRSSGAPATSPIPSSPAPVAGSTNPSPTHANPKHTALPHHQAPATTTHTTGPTTPTPAGSPLIAGRLIEGVRTLPLSTSPLARTAAARQAAAAAAAVRPAVHTSFVALLLGIVSAVFLLALGAARELQWRPRLPALRPGG